jgi:Tfp pilus assembly protein PilF
VKRLFLPFFLLLFFGGVAFAQQPPAGRVTVNVRGQVYGPNGAPLQTTIRLQLSGEDGRRPPEYYFTDSKGAFVLGLLAQGAGYTLIVESDGKTWATTRVSFYALGLRPYVLIHLLPFESAPSPGTSVSVAELNQNVPHGARKEYESAIQQLAAGDLLRARKGFERAIQLFPDFVEARSELAVVSMREGDLPAAEALLRRALELDSAAVRPLLNLGLCLYRQQRYAEALPFLERGVQLHPVNAHGNFLYGITLVMAGDDARAEPVLLKAYEQGGKHYAKAQLYLSQLFVRQKKFERAAEALDIYLRDLPDAPDAHDLRATLSKLRAASRP